MKDLHFQEELDENLKKGLSALPTTERSADSTAAGRAAFLNQVEIARQSVSPVQKVRHTGWIANLAASFQTRKEKKPMWTAIVTIIAVLTMALGGGGITVAAAQSAMPDDALYSVKTWTEDVRYDLASTDEARLDLTLQFAERRMTEIKTMLEQGTPPEQALASKYQAQVETALQLATGMDTTDEAVQSLALVYQQLLDQQMLMQQIQTQMQSQTQQQNMGETQQLMNQFMTQAQMMLQYSLHYAQQGIQDPQFLEQQQQMMQQQQFQFQFSFSFGTQEDAEPGNPWTGDAGSPSGSGYGFGGGDGITPPDQGQGTRPWTEAPGIQDGNSTGGSANGGGSGNGNSGSNSNGGSNGGTNGGSNGGSNGGGGGGGN